MQKRVGIIGWPVEHSLSPAMHNAAFAALGMTDWFYDRMAIPPDVVKQAVKETRDHGYIGLNVTVPLKEAVMPFVRPDERARKIGAVNTIMLYDLTATNTDVDGLMDDLAANDVAVAGRQVLVLGAGGAARAAVYGLAEAGADITIANRTSERAEALIASMGVTARALPLEQAARGPIDVIINCTSVGMWPKIEDCPWPDELPFPEGVTVYDTIYRPARSRLIERAEQHDGRGINGLGMLVRQGAKAFQLWTKTEPPVDVMFDAARRTLEG